VMTSPPAHRRVLRNDRTQAWVRRRAKDFGCAGRSGAAAHYRHADPHRSVRMIATRPVSIQRVSQPPLNCRHIRL
jgi:hypothetical protein